MLWKRHFQAALEKAQWKGLDGKALGRVPGVSPLKVLVQCTDLILLGKQQPAHPSKDQTVKEK